LNGTRMRTNSNIVKASELSFTNLPGGESLVLTGEGSIPDTFAGYKVLSLGTLSFASGTGSAANYTFVGGTFKFRLRHPLTTRAGVMEFLRDMKGDRNKRQFPSKTFYRRPHAVGEKVKISTPDRSIEVEACVMQSGYCN